MRRWITCVALVALAGCGGDDPHATSPVRTVEAVVTIEWPLAREPGFVDARYSISRIDVGPELVSGPFPESGIAEAGFTAQCQGQYYRVYAVGHWAAWEGHPDLPDDAIIDCLELEIFRVTNCSDSNFALHPGPQNPPDWECTPPVE